MNNSSKDTFGYSINHDILRTAFCDATGNELDDDIKNWFVASAPYLVMAYEAGIQGRPLTEVLPFLKKST